MLTETKYEYAGILPLLLLSTSRKGISGCAAGEGEVSRRAVGKGFGTLCAKKSPYSSSMGLHLAATVKPAAGSALFSSLPDSRAPQGSPSIPGDHHGTGKETAGCQSSVLLSFCWPSPPCSILLREAGVGSSDTGCSSGWGRRGCLSQPMGEGNVRGTGGTVTCQMRAEIFFQPAWADLELLPQVELPFLREQPQPPGDGRKFRLFCILLGEGGAGQVSAPGIQSPWQHRGRGWPSFFLQG